MNEVNLILRLANDVGGKPKISRDELLNHLSQGNINFDVRDDEICFLKLKTNNNQIIAVIENKLVDNLYRSYQSEKRRANSLEREIKGIALNIVHKFPEIKEDIL